MSVESKLGCHGSLESRQVGEEDGSAAAATLSHEQLLPGPDEAADFVSQTGVDALTIAIRAGHGAYKFSRKRHRSSSKFPTPQLGD